MKAFRVAVDTYPEQEVGHAALGEGADALAHFQGEAEAARV